MNQVKTRIAEIGCRSRSRLRVAKGRARQDGEPGRDRAAPDLRGVRGQVLASDLAGHWGASIMRFSLRGNERVMPTYLVGQVKRKSVFFFFFFIDKYFCVCCS